MEQLIWFHDHTMITLVLVTTFVGFILGRLGWNTFVNRTLLEKQWVEAVWTRLPAFILLFIALPSLRLLYLLDEVNDPSVTLKVIGHQWYWSYEYRDLKEVRFDSYMVSTEALDVRGFRVLDVDARAIVPFQTQIRVLVTAADVIHSWALPGVGVKVDAVPGRLNQTRFFRTRAGLLFGQCSEICGANHRFIPVVLERVPPKVFVRWVLKG